MKAAPVYVPPDAKGAPYVYFAAADYTAHDRQPFRAPAAAGAATRDGAAGILRPYYRDDPANPAQPEPIDPRSFQIISAGIDGDYGAGAGPKGPLPSFLLRPGSEADRDNLTNFAPQELGAAATAPQRSTAPQR